MDHATTGTIDATIAPGNPDQLLVTGGTTVPYPNNGDVWVERADVDDATPTRQFSAVWLWPPPVVRPPHIAAIEDPAGTQVALIWDQTDGVAAAVNYAHSDDGGATFSTFLTLTSAPLGGSFSTDVAMDAGGVVQAVWTYVDDVTETGQFTYRRATNLGESASDWSPCSCLSYSHLQLRSYSSAVGPVRCRPRLCMCST